MMTETHTCETCGTEYRSFATYTRQDPCYRNRKAARLAVREGEVPFDDVTTTTGAVETGSARYGKDAAAAMAKADHEIRTGRTTSNQYGTFHNHRPSEKQVAFAKRLLAERPSYELTVAVDDLDKRQISRIIDELLAMPVEVVSEASRPSDKQMDFLRRLLAERDHGGLLHADDIRTKAEASAMIDALMALPKISQEQRDAKAGRKVIDQDGIYFLEQDGEVTIFKVQRAVHGSGNLYAKRLVLPAGDADKGEWVYEGRKPLYLNLQPLSLEKAKEFGQLYGVCMNCGHTLTDESSIEAGIGPVCAKRL